MLYRKNLSPVTRVYVSHMTPYARFRAISVLLSTCILIGTILVGMPVLAPWLASSSASMNGVVMLTGLGLGLLVVWGVLALLIVPAILRLPLIRRLVLGRYHVEGTWIEAVRGGPSGPRLAVLTIKPAADGYCLSATTVLRTGEAVRSWRMAFGAFDGQVLSFKYDVTLSSEASDAAGGVGEIQFEMTGGTTKRYVGGRNGMDGERVSVEGVRLTSLRERWRLKRAESRGEVVSAYWAQFFEAGLPKIDRAQKGNGKTAPKTRDNMRKTDTTPTADKIRKQFDAPSISGRA